MAGALTLSGHNGAVPAPSRAASASSPDAAPWPPAATLMARSRRENFPVASRVLPAHVRGHLLALYGYARLTDALGDEQPGDRLAALDWLEGELDRAYAGTATYPLMVRLSGTLAVCPLPRHAFARLIEANRVDQRVSRYESYEQLLEYCALSANPVGELVLGVFGLATPVRVALSDRICSALQLAEHWQDVAEDRDRGRIYLPAADMRSFGVDARDLGKSRADPRLRRLIAFEVERARKLLREGTPLLGTLHGRERVAVAAFLGGGRAALDAIERADFDVLSGAPRATRPRRLAALAGVLLSALAHRPGGARPQIRSHPASR
jgi:squalene synthase HpnC